MQREAWPRPHSARGGRRPPKERSAGPQKEEAPETGDSGLLRFRMGGTCGGRGKPRHCNLDNPAAGHFNPFEVSGKSSTSGQGRSLGQGLRCEKKRSPGRRGGLAGASGFRFGGNRMMGEGTPITHRYITPDPLRTSLPTINILSWFRGEPGPRKRGAAGRSRPTVSAPRPASFARRLPLCAHTSSANSQNRLGMWRC